MTDAEFEATRERVLRIAERWYETLGFGVYHIDWCFDRDQHDGQDVVALLDIQSQWEYRRMHITAYLAPIARICPRDRDLEYHVVHEFAHAWLDKLRPDEELTATQVADALIWTRDAVLEAPDEWRTEPPMKMGERARAQATA
jgi:hypothetical protein